MAASNTKDEKKISKKKTAPKKAAVKKAAVKKAAVKKPEAKKAAPRKKVATKSTAKAKIIAIDSNERQRMIAEAAYYKAASRNFAHGDTNQDWLEAEAEINVRFPQ